MPSASRCRTPEHLTRSETSTVAGMAHREALPTLPLKTTVWTYFNACRADAISMGAEQAYASINSAQLIVIVCGP